MHKGMKCYIHNRWAIWFWLAFDLLLSSVKQTKKQTNKLYLTRVTLNSEITDKPVALGFQIELEFGNVGF